MKIKQEKKEAVRVIFKINGNLESHLFSIFVSLSCASRSESFMWTQTSLALLADVCFTKGADLVNRKLLSASDEK
jgi:hypothetical protein